MVIFQPYRGEWSKHYFVTVCRGPVTGYCMLQNILNVNEYLFNLYFSKRV
jgi:hypothetical protein